MPSTEFPEQLERVKRRGRQLRRRRTTIRGAASTIALLAVVLLVPTVVGDGADPDPADVAIGGPTGEDGRLDVGPQPGPRSRPESGGDGQREGGSADEPAQEGDLGAGEEPVDPGPTRGEPSAALDDSEGMPAEGCRHSYDSDCGALRWDPAPGDDQPVTIDVSASTMTPRVGEQVTFTITATDPDAEIHVVDCRHHHDFGDGTSTAGCHPECPTPHGTWTTPPRERGEQTFVRTHTYDQPGERTASFTVFSGEPCEPNPYAGKGTATVTLVVLPA